eukprot:3776682-Pleurochrysis_carterae.AAC.2
MRKEILTGFGCEGISMATVRAMAFVYKSSLWMLQSTISSDAHIPDVLPTMWTTAFAFFEQAAASPVDVTDSTLELIVEDVRKERLTARTRRAALNMARMIRELAAGDAAVERLVSAAFSAMPAATRNHVAEFLPGARGHLRCGADHPHIARALELHADDEHGR